MLSSTSVTFSFVRNRLWGDLHCSAMFRTPPSPLSLSVSQPRRNYPFFDKLIRRRLTFNCLQCDPFQQVRRLISSLSKTQTSKRPQLKSEIWLPHSTQELPITNHCAQHNRHHKNTENCQQRNDQQTRDLSLKRLELFTVCFRTEKWKTRKRFPFWSTSDFGSYWTLLKTPASVSFLIRMNSAIASNTTIACFYFSASTP